MVQNGCRAGADWGGGGVMRLFGAKAGFVLVLGVDKGNYLVRFRRVGWVLGWCWGRVVGWRREWRQLGLRCAILGYGANKGRNRRKQRLLQYGSLAQVKRKNSCAALFVFRAIFVF